MRIIPDAAGVTHLRFMAEGSRVPVSRVDELLELVGLEHAAGRRVGGYSLGMRQRLGLAMALLGDPPVLVLDEPGNGLDPAGLRWLRDLLRARASDGNTVFVSSHLLPEMQQLADDLVVIDKGRLVSNGAVSELTQTAALVRSPSAEDLEQILESAGATIQSQSDGRLLVFGLSPAEIGDRAHAASIVLHELGTQGWLPGRPVPCMDAG